MGKGAESVQFLIDIKDNDMVDGDKHYNVTAAVYSSACDCYASELSGGLVSQTLTVLDDDGPHLSITSASQAFLEGSSDNVITITRNTNPDSDITVTISSDKDDLLEYNHSVIIPSGATSADVKVSVLSNETSGDGDIVSFKAESGNMAAGSCWVVLTDQTLPDATIQLEVAQDSPSAGESVDLILTISNIGNAPLQRNTPIDVQCTGVKGAQRVYTKKAIEKGDNDRLVVEDFQLPERTGLVTLSAVINDNESVTELLYSNNKAKSVELTLSPAFDVTASVDKNIYIQEESVIISGHASGDAGKNAKIEIHLSNNGVRQVLNAVTDDDGNYEYKYKLLPRQTGHFTVSACYPTSSPVEDAATFDVYGLQLNKAFITCEPGLGETFNGTFRLSNPGNLSQNSLKIEKISVPANCEFTFDAPSKIDAGETIDIKFSLKGTGLSNGKEFEKIPLSITTEEGTKTTFTVYYYIQSLHGKLYTSTPSISTTMLKDTPRDYPLVIRNIGKGETGKISFALPSWVETVTPREMASLAAGDSTTVMLSFKPMDEMKLNVATKGKLGVNCSNGDGISISFDIMPVSEAIGKLKIDVVDEFTFYTEEAPHVSNAQIKITHPTSKEVIVEGRTDNNGIFTTEMNEGWYIMTVEADNHDIYTENIIINPGMELSKEVFMPYQAITYNWTVEETEIDDEYVFETTVDFDTRVPKPVIVISLPDEKPEPFSVVPVKITNKGLINAVNIEMSLEVSDGYTLEFLNDPTAEVLAPQQTLVFYAKLLPTESSSEVRAKAPRANRECIWIISKAKYQELCQKYTGDQFVRMLKKYGKKSCFNSGSSSGGSGGHGGGYGGSGSVGRPGCWGGGSSYGSDYYVIDWSNPEKYCDRKPDANPKDSSGDNDDPTNQSPVDLPLVDEGEPEEQECNEDPVFVFKMIPTNGPRYSLKGVTADGASQVKIVLDPSVSKLPNKNCSFVSDLFWELDKNVGTINPTSDYEAIYTAPNNFDESLSEIDGHVIKVSARLNYTLIREDGTSKAMKSDPIEIRIFRPLIVFVHGLGDSDNCWRSLQEDLVNSEGYFRQFTYLVNYKNSNTEEFENNIHHVGKGIRIVKRNALNQGIMAYKCDIIGHSMGGILARLYAQTGTHDDEINRIITVNTPHAGSEIGDMVEAHDIIGRLGAGAFYSVSSMQNKFLNLNAIRDLAVESEATFNLNHPRYIPSIPVFSYGTETADKNNVFVTKLIGIGLSWGFVKGIKTVKEPRIVAALIVAKYFNHLVTDDIVQASPGDLIVSSESQTGGCDASKILKDGPWHVASPSDANVKNDIISLIKDYSKDNFSTGWFHPRKRSFNHFNWMPGQILDFVPYIGDVKSIVEIGMATFEWTSATKKSKSPNTNLDRALDVRIKNLEDYSDFLSIVNIGEELIPYEGSEFKCWIPNSFIGDVKVTTFMKEKENGNIYYFSQEYPVESYNATLEKIEADDLIIDVGELTSCQVKCYWSDGETTYENGTVLSIMDSNILEQEHDCIKGKKEGKTNVTLTFNNLSCSAMVRVFAPEKSNNNSDDSDAICSTVSLSFKQSAVMTRQAFRGIFSLNNGHQTATLRDFKLNLEVKDEDGVVATRREFEITPEKLAGFQGSLDFNSGWSLEPSHNGEASILFIPTKYAAPTEPKEYSFGGTFSYIDPYTGLTVTRTLNPVTLTVNPSPQLELTYFMQRDVFGDDPLTEEIEPMKPAEFALLLNNIGAGDATSLKLTTGQPQIVSNEKGLYINFELVSSQLNGGEQSLMLGGSAVTDFGSLKAGEQSYAQWWLQSSLLGHFVKYDVKSTHVTSHDNPNLSLVDTVTIHELIHGFDLMKDDIRRRAFLVNDIADVLDTPDQLYFTDGTQVDVAIARDAFITKENDLEYILNVSASAPGWNYGTISDPTNGRQSLSSIKRMSDGSELAIDNFWQTDRTLRDGKDPLAENLLHFIDNFPNSDATYRLTFTPKPDIELAVDSVIGLPEEDDILTEQLKTVTVKFNKPIDSSTFTIEDLSLFCQGERIDISQVAITFKTDTDFDLDLSSATLENGFYVLSIQTSSISDVEGFAGATGKQVSWIQYVDGKIKLVTMATPAEGGSVTPVPGLYDYDSNVKLQATPSEGYKFLGWWCGDDLISENLETEVSLTEDKEYTARFILQQFNISVNCNEEGGYIEGTATGIYDFGQLLRVEAVPNYGWSFSHWTVNGSEISDTTGVLEIPTNQDTEIYATFISHIKESAIPLYQGWNWVSSVFDDKGLHSPTQFFKSIKPVLAEVRTKDGTLVVDDGILDGSIERMIPGTYKVRVNNTTALRLKGATVYEDSYEVKLCQGWTWLPFVPANEQNVGEALVNLAAKENDILKSHTQFAVFSDGRWLGTLKSFVPNEGYMYYSSEPATFKYPSEAVSSYSSSSENNSPWQYNEKGFADNKTIVANILDNGTPVSEEDYFVGAFCGEECRGISEYADGSLFIMVHGTQGDNISFKAINNDSGEIREIKESITFDENPLGSIATPYNLNFETTSGINDILVGYGLKITPNPVKDIMYLEGNLSDVKSIRVIATSGLTVISTDSFEHGVNVSSIPDGVYVAAITTTNGEVYKKFIKKGY